MHRDGRRAFVFLIIAVAATAAVLVTIGAPVAAPVVERARVEAVASSTGVAIHGPQHSVPSIVASAPSRLVSSHNGCRVAGTVRLPDGTPVAEAEVSMTTLGEHGEWSIGEMFGAEASATTDEHGRFELESPPGDFALHASEGDRASNLIEPLSLAPGEEIRDLEVVLVGNGKLSGIVVDEKGEKAAARIEVRLAGHEELIYTGDAAEDGLFSTSLPDAPIVVVAIGDTDGARVERTLPHPEADLVLRLGSPLGELTIETVDEAGQPVDGATITVSTSRGMGSMMISSDNTATYQPTDRHITIVAETTEARSDNVELDVDASPRSVRIVLKPAAKLSGRIVTAEGEGVAGYAELQRLGTSGQPEDAGTAGLDDDSKYAFTGLLPGRYRIRYADGVGDTPGELAQLEVQLSSGQVLELADLRLPRPRKITGIVRGVDGEPAKDADIEIVDARQTSTSTRSITTSDDGRFVVDDVYGTVRLRAAGMEGELSAIVLASASGDEEINLGLQPTGNIEGVLRGRQGKPSRVRCDGGLWHDVEKNGQYHVSCPVGSSLEIESEGATRSFPVEIDEQDDTYVELRW